MISPPVPQGVPLPFCFFHSHRENASGSTVPPVGPPQITVAEAVMVVELTPRMGANQCCLTPALLTVTCEAVSEVTVAVDVALLRFEVANCCAVWPVEPHVPRAQSCATASAPASAPVCSR